MVLKEKESHRQSEAEEELPQGPHSGSIMLSLLAGNRTVGINTVVHLDQELPDAVGKKHLTPDTTQG